MPDLFSFILFYFNQEGITDTFLSVHKPEIK